jgi:hypothetical protein
VRERVRTIWVPGLATMLLAFAGQAILFHYESLHHVIELRGLFLVISVPWLALLAASGAIGAYMCFYEGGTPRQRLLVAVFPAMVMGAFLMASFAVGFVVDPQVPVRVRVTSMAGFTLWETVLPAMALLMGATPVVASEQLELHTQKRA